MQWLTEKILLFLGGLLILTLPSISQANSDKQITIFSAASLTPALTEISKKFQQSADFSPVFSFASSGSLARQISAGASADIFISANVKWADWLKKNNPTSIQKDVSIISNRLALVMVKNHTPRSINIKDLSYDIGDQRIAIGDPNHVPAGIYAKQVLNHFGLWGKLSKNIAPAQNIRAALYLLQTQATPYGIIYQSDLSTNKHIELIEIFPTESHDPIIYRSMLLSSKKMNSEGVKEFYDFLSSDLSKPIFKKFGFIPVD